MDKKISISQIKEVVQQAYELVKGNTGGKNADYIPYLANIDKNLFGISVCLLNGQTITVGDFDYRFGIESVSKVHTAILIPRFWTPPSPPCKRRCRPWRKSRIKSVSFLNCAWIRKPSPRFSRKPWNCFSNWRTGWNRNRNGMVMNSLAC